MLFHKHQIILFVALAFNNVLCSLEDCGEIKGEITSLPWNVGLYIENQNQLELKCFGSIIKSNAILTAAHCFYESTGKYLQNGTFYVTQNILKKINIKKPMPIDFYKVDKSNIILNEHYGGLHSFLLNDLAIIKGKFNWKNKIKCVCVDWSDDITDENPNEKEPIWDNTQTKISDQSYLNFDECSSTVPQSFVLFITQDKACTITKGSKAYVDHASEGGGLFFLNPKDKRWYIKGVISMHELTQGKISTYTPIKQNVNWISNVCATL